MKRLTTIVFALLVSFAMFATPVMAQDDAGASDSSGLAINEAKAAKGVEERQPVEPGASFSVGDKVWLWMSVANSGDETQVTLVWKKDDKKVWETNLNVGRSTQWKTWARKTMRSAGSYSVDIQNPAGEVLSTVSFTVSE